MKSQYTLYKREVEMKLILLGCIIIVPQNFPILIICVVSRKFVSTSWTRVMLFEPWDNTVRVEYMFARKLVNLVVLLEFFFAYTAFCELFLL